MKYVICDNETKKYFLMGASNNGPKWVDSIDEATHFKTKRGAEDAKKYQPICKGKMNLTISIIADITKGEEGTEINIISINDNEAQTAFTNFSNAINMLQEGMQYIDSLISHYNQELSKYDLMEQDILHKIEFDTISGFMAVQLVKKLKEIRIKRRECKDKRDFFQSVRDGGGSKLIESMNNYNNHIENRSYSVRVLTEIFGGKEVVKNENLAR